MNKKDYIKAIDKLEFNKNLKQITLNNLQNYTKRVTFNWKYKLIIATASMGTYFLCFGNLTCI